MRTSERGDLTYLLLLGIVWGGLDLAPERLMKREAEIDAVLC